MDISVIVPTYNRSRQLKLCLQALCVQSFPADSFEIIVVDDGSRDNTRGIAEYFTGRNKIKYIYQKNKGCSAARNAGIKQATGNILAFIDDDIIAPPFWLDNIMTAFKNNVNFHIIQGPCHYRKSSGPLLEAMQYLSSFADRLRIIESPDFYEGKEAVYIGTGNLAIKRDIVFQHGLFFDEILRRRQDEDYYRVVQQLGIKVGFIPNSALHDCHLSLAADFDRFFNYGKGEYYLQKKWGHFIRIPYKIKVTKIIRELGLWRGVIIKIIIEIRWVYWGLGFLYEKFKDYGTKVKKPSDDSS